MASRMTIEAICSRQIMSRSCIVLRQNPKLVYNGLFCRSYSGFDEPGRVLREEERSREAIYMRKREAELLERLRKQSDKLDQIKMALAEYKNEQAALQEWLDSTKQHLASEGQ